LLASAEGKAFHATEADSSLDLLEVKYNIRRPGQYYPIGIIATVPRAYDIFRAYEGMEEETKKLRKENVIQNSNKKNIFFKPKSTICLPVKWKVCDKSTFLSVSS
jgi:hypothetical protein